MKRFRDAATTAAVRIAHRFPHGPALADRAMNAALDLFERFYRGDFSNVRVTRDGIDYALDLREDVQRKIYLDCYEKLDWGHLAPLLRLGDTVIDVGAQIGFYTLRCARAVGPSGRVIAFEPDPRNAGRLRANVVANAFDGRVTILEEALSNAAGSRALNIASERHTGWNSLERYDDIAVGALPVRCERLSEVARREGVERVRLLKIDVEGHEPAVLEGAEALLAGNRIDYVYLEVNQLRLHQTGSGLESIERFLVPHGYRRTTPLSVPTAPDALFNALYAAPQRDDLAG